MPKTYTVVAGDTLQEIAQEFYGDASMFLAIAAANGITDPDTIYVGMMLVIPDITSGDPTPPTPPSEPAPPSGPTPPAPPAPVSPLEISARQVLKGTLVPLKVSVQDDANGLLKFGTVNQLALAPGETDAVREHLAAADPPTGNKEADRISATTLDLFRSFERPIVYALRPGIAAVAAVPTDELSAFAAALVEVRTQRTRAAQEDQLLAATVGGMMLALNAAVVAAKSFAINTAAQPIGMLNLERIEMVPAGIQRGELVATIPLAPGEETAVTHKEWSVTTKEFTTIVTDSLEKISETGVTDNTDLSQSTTSQNQHSTQFNITGTVQGGIPIINGSSTAGVTAQDANSTSAVDSIKHATSITQRASARSRSEHKTTIATTTVTGTSETSTRILKNTSATDPIRIDYFSLMRKWRVRLYRFGLRLTYDMVVPEPGAAMREDYATLAKLRAKQGPFVFTVQNENVKHSDITTALVDRITGHPAPMGAPNTMPRYKWFADQFQTSVPPHPEPDPPSPVTKELFDAGVRDFNSPSIEFDVPANTRITRTFIDLFTQSNGGTPSFRMIGTTTFNGAIEGENLTLSKKPLFADDADPNNPEAKPFLAGRTGHQFLIPILFHVQNIRIKITAELEWLPDHIENWRNEVWNALYSAAQMRYYAEQQDIAARLGAIEEKLANVDTLTLRREESDEIMKSVLKFVLGADFDFMPSEVHKAFEAGAVDLSHGVAFDGQKLGLSKDQWTALRQHEDIARFINQAIEWENVVTFLYSYFWDVPESWAFIRQLRHPDATRQAFLRAGSARVVLTVRKGWEAKWMRFTQDLSVDVDIDQPGTGPYLSIAQEIAAYDDRNYPGIPPANPAKAAARLQDAVYTTSSEGISPSPSPDTPVSIPVASSAGFVVGLGVVLDVEDEGHIQESAVITEIPDDGTHIVVDMVVHPHGTDGPFPLLQPGDKGALIAEWNEYTPSSGTDIAVTSNLATIA